MILALDVGNTNIVIGCIDKDNIYFEGRVATDKNKTETEYAVMLKNILDIYDVDLNKLEGAIVSSVVPPLNEVLKKAVLAVTGFLPVLVDAKKKTGLKLMVDKPDEVGSDLLVAAVAAVSEYNAPLIIIDMGTATTISVIDEGNVFLGGAILPGVKISLDALSKGTAQLPGISFSSDGVVIGKNTVDCMRSGMIFGTASMIDGMISRIEKELKKSTTVIATGGLAGGIIPHCQSKIIYRDDLLIKGLFVLWEKNK